MITTDKTMRIQTYSGLAFSIFDPDPALINIEDIAHALSNLTRFTGHAKRFYSIAEHCIHVALLLPSEMRLAGLLHDAAEAYINDLSTPLKYGPGLEGYRAIEKVIERAILDRFNLDPALKSHIKHADRVMLVNEANTLLSKPLIPEWNQLITEIGKHPKVKLHCWTPARAKREYLSFFQEINGTAYHDGRGII